MPTPNSTNTILIPDDPFLLPNAGVEFLPQDTVLLPSTGIIILLFYDSPPPTPSHTPTHHPHYFHTTYSHLNTHTTKHHRNLHTVGYNTSSILSIDLFLRNIPSRLCIRMANMCSHSTSCSADQYLHDSSV